GGEGDELALPDACGDEEPVEGHARLAVQQHPRLEVLQQRVRRPSTRAGERERVPGGGLVPELLERLRVSERQVEGREPGGRDGTRERDLAHAGAPAIP